MENVNFPIPAVEASSSHLAHVTLLAEILRVKTQYRFSNVFVVYGLPVCQWLCQHM
jgi:hypothetical protein